MHNPKLGFLTGGNHIVQRVASNTVVYRISELP